MSSVDFKLLVNDGALNKIRTVLTDKSSEYFFRIEITSGGCAGFSTAFKIDDVITNDDFIIEKDDIKIVINNKIADFIKEAELKYHTDIMSSYFQLAVKNATSTCSCGTSFSI